MSFSQYLDRIEAVRTDLARTNRGLFVAIEFGRAAANTALIMLVADAMSLGIAAPGRRLPMFLALMLPVVLFRVIMNVRL